MTREDYQKQLAEFIEASIAFKKSGRAGRVLGILNAKLLPALEKVNEYVKEKQPRKTRFKVVTKGDAKPKPQPKPQPEEEPIERKILADSETKKPRKRKSRKKQTPPKQD